MSKICICDVISCMHCPACCDENSYLWCNQQIAVQFQFVYQSMSGKPYFTNFVTTQERQMRDFLPNRIEAKWKSLICLITHFFFWLRWHPENQRKNVKLAPFCAQLRCRLKLPWHWAPSSEDIRPNTIDKVIICHLFATALLSDDTEDEAIGTTFK